MTEQDFDALIEEVVELAQRQAAGEAGAMARLDHAVARAVQVTSVIRNAHIRLEGTAAEHELTRAVRDYIELLRGEWATGQEYVARMFAIPLIFRDAAVLPQTFSTAAVAEAITGQLQQPKHTSVVVAPTPYTYSEIAYVPTAGYPEFHAALLTDLQRSSSSANPRQPGALGIEQSASKLERAEVAHNMNLRFIVLSVAIPAEVDQYLPNTVVGAADSGEAVTAEAQRIALFGTDTVRTMSETLAEGAFEQAIQQALDEGMPENRYRPTTEVRAAMPLDTCIDAGRHIFEIGTLQYIAMVAPTETTHVVLNDDDPEALDDRVMIEFRRPDGDTGELVELAALTFEDLPGGEDDVLEWYEHKIPLISPAWSLLRKERQSNAQDAAISEPSNDPVAEELTAPVNSMAELLMYKARAVTIGAPDNRLWARVAEMLDNELDADVHAAVDALRGSEPDAHRRLEAVVQWECTAQQVDVGGRTSNLRLGALPVWFELDGSVPSTLPARLVTQRLNEYGVLAPDVTFLATSALYRYDQLATVTTEQAQSIQDALLTAGMPDQLGPNALEITEATTDSPTSGIGLRYIIGLMIAPSEEPEKATQHLDRLPSGGTPNPALETWFSEMAQELITHYPGLTGQIRLSLPQPFRSALNNGLPFHGHLTNHAILSKIPKDAKRVAITVDRTTGLGGCEIEVGSGMFGISFEWPVNEVLGEQLEVFRAAIENALDDVPIILRID